MSPWGLSILLGSLLIGAAARADSIESSTSAGSGTLIQDFHYQGQGKGEEHMTWSLEAGFTGVSSGDTSSAGASVSASPSNEQTYQFTGEVGWEQERGWELSGGLEYATGNESLHDAGPTGSLGYTFAFGPHAEKKPAESKAESKKEEGDDGDDEADEEFTPTLTVKGTGEYLGYTADFTKPSGNSSVQASRGGSASDQIGQLSYGGEIGVAPFEWARIKGEFTRYRYNKDVNLFVSKLDSVKALPKGLQGLSTALQGFPDYMAALTLTLRPHEDWEAELELSGTRNANDLTFGRGYKATLSHDLGETWTVGIGAEYDNSPDITQALGLLDLSYQL